VRTSAFAAVLIVAIAIAAGCGDSRTPTEKFAAKLSGMCEDFAQREQEIGEPTGLDDLAARGDRLVTAFEETLLTPLRELKAPAEVEPQAAQLRVLARQQRDVLRQLAAAGKAGDVGRVRQLVARNTTLNRQAGMIADQLGATSCTS
jgi:hypothetical protein